MKNLTTLKKLRSRRGVAMESAVLFMLIILALCTLVITLSLLGRHQINNNHNEIIADIEKDQIVEDFLAYVSAVTVTAAASEGGTVPSPSTPPAEGTSSFYDYITNGRNAAIAQRYREFYAPDTGRYNCFDERNQDGDTMTFTLYALNSQTNELILCAEATKTAEQVQADGSVKQGTVTLKYCL
ncbi:MAG: hypothetical protein J6Q16_00210, partial [Clostridia bacterium]|nr:hypothetical protein [Clostridia bacterium]